MANRYKWKDFSLPLDSVLDGTSAQFHTVQDKQVRISIGPHGSIIVQSMEILSFMVSLQKPSGRVLHDGTTHHGSITIAFHRSMGARNRGATSLEFIEIPRVEQ